MATKTRKGLGPLGSTLLSKLSAEKRDEVFTVADAEALSGLKGAKLRELLYNLMLNKWIERIERGKYLILPLNAGPNANYGTHPYVIARKLVCPYYVGFSSALNYFGITEQVSRTTYVATTKQRKPITFHAQEYKFVALDEKRFFGIGEEWIGDLKFNISDREKTVVDCLFMPRYSGGLTEVVKAFRGKIDYGKLYDYALRMDNIATLKRFGYLLDGLKLNASISKKLLPKVSGGYCLLDTNGPKTGPKNEKWRVIENIPLEELKVEL